MSELKEQKCLYCEKKFTFNKSDCDYAELNLFDPGIEHHTYIEDWVVNCKHCGKLLQVYGEHSMFWVIK